MNLQDKMKSNPEESTQKTKTQNSTDIIEKSSQQLETAELLGKQSEAIRTLKTQLVEQRIEYEEEIQAVTSENSNLKKTLKEVDKIIRSQDKQIAQFKKNYVSRKDYAILSRQKSHEQERANSAYNKRMELKALLNEQKQKHTEDLEKRHKIEIGLFAYSVVITIINAIILIC